MGNILRTTITLGFVVVLSACSPQRGDTSNGAALSAPPTAAPSATPAAIPTTQAVRPTPEWVLILRYQAIYLTREGVAHRGNAFERLVEEMGMAVATRHAYGEATTRPSAVKARLARHQAISMLEVLAVLGPPDYWTANENATNFVYRYRSSGTRLTLHGFEKFDEDWVAFIDIDAAGMLSSVGVNNASVNDLTAYRPYHPEDAMKLTASWRPLGEGFLGVVVQEPVATNQLDGHAGGGGLRVMKVIQDSPAEKAGLQPGDVIEAIDGTPLVNDSDLSELVRAMEPGQTTTLSVLRPGAGSTESRSARRIVVTVGRWPKSATQP